MVVVNSRNEWCSHSLFNRFCCRIIFRLCNNIYCRSHTVAPHVLNSSSGVAFINLANICHYINFFSSQWDVRKMTSVCVVCIYIMSMSLLMPAQHASARQPLEKMANCALLLTHSVSILVKRCFDMFDTVIWSLSLCSAVFALTRYNHISSTFSEQIFMQYCY